MNKILLVGANGFIGRRIFRKLRDKYDVRCLLLSEESHTSLKQYIGEDFEYSVGTIADAETCDDETRGIDTVINLAARLSSDESVMFENNVNGFFELASAAVKNGVKSFCYASSALVYGNSDELQKENAGINPIDFYSKTKQLNEIIAEHYNQTSDTHFIGLRYFNVYGSDKLSSKDVVSKFFNNAMRNLPLSVSNNNAFRDMIYVEDVADITIALMEKKVPKDISLINVGTGIGTRISDLAKMIIGITDSKSTIDVHEDTNIILTSIASTELLTEFCDFRFSPLEKMLKDIYSKNRENWTAALKGKK